MQLTFSIIPLPCPYVVRAKFGPRQALMRRIDLICGKNLGMLFKSSYKLLRPGTCQGGSLSRGVAVVLPTLVSISDGNWFSFDALQMLIQRWWSIRWHCHSMDMWRDNVAKVRSVFRSCVNVCILVCHWAVCSQILVQHSEVTCGLPCMLRRRQGVWGLRPLRLPAVTTKCARQ